MLATFPWTPAKWPMEQCCLISRRLPFVWQFVIMSVFEVKLQGTMRVLNEEDTLMNDIKGDKMNELQKIPMVV